MTPESSFLAKLISELERQYPGAIILKNDANQRQGFPDRLILWQNHWAAFEGKAHRDSTHQPNQDYYVNLLNNMSYAKFVYPDNMEIFLYELQRSFGFRRTTRLPVR